MTALRMFARRVRVPGVPVDFRVPVGWPTPTDRWVQDNAFWRPSPGWTPRPGLQPAPKGWRYWSPNPGWRNATTPVYRSIRPWARASAIVGALSLIVVVLSLFAEISGVAQALGWTFGVVAATSVAIYGMLRRRLTRVLMVEAAAVAEQARWQRMVREYQRYRWAVG